MPELPPEPHPTRDAIYKTYVDKSGDWRRTHLGASIIGQECERRIWYDFHWCTKPEFDGRMYRLFQTGFSQEERLLNDLRNAGIEIISEESGDQIHYEDFGGHYSGSLDAIGIGFPEAPSTYHVVECKTMNTKTFNQLKSKGVKLVKFEHFCQMQVYMGWSGLDRAFYLAVCKETDELYDERIYFDQELFDRLRLKADRVVFADGPLHRISDNPESFKCKWCPHKWSCHDLKLPEVNCRTCAFSEVLADGKWGCTRYKTELSKEQQKVGCDIHIFIPDLVPLEQTDADDTKGWIMYGDIINGFGATASKDLQEKIV